MKEDEDEDEIKARRELLGALGTGVMATSSGCLGLFGEDAPELKNRADETEEELQSDLPWGEYPLSFQTNDTNVGLTQLGQTGVENAHTYRVNISMDLADESDDLINGYLETENLQEEFFTLLSNPTYDALVTTVENFYEFQPQNQPSHRNQVVEYKVRVDGEKCSYVKDTLPAERVNEVLSTGSAYESYVLNGNGFETSTDTGVLGLGGVSDYFC